ncbi:UNVERIFIED_CONTAM: hypothetical protein FKN15_056171 [Acipenser sinensis]
MTSLFRRSSSRGGSAGSNDGAPGNGSSAAPQDLNNSRPAARPVRRLEFNQAMEDFKIMFPSVDSDVIECVLRANSGAVEATINQLLQMNMDGSDDSDDSDDSIPPEVGCSPASERPACSWDGQVPLQSQSQHNCLLKLQLLFQCYFSSIPILLCC